MISMTTLVSDEVHLFTGWSDIPMDKLHTFNFLKKLAYLVFQIGLKFEV